MLAVFPSLTLIVMFPAKEFLSIYPERMLIVQLRTSTEKISVGDLFA
jgi:hypothetical protein